MKKELKSGTLSADHRSINRPTVGGVNVIAIYDINYTALICRSVQAELALCCSHIMLSQFL